MRYRISGDIRKTDKKEIDSRQTVKQSRKKQMRQLGMAAHLLLLRYFDPVQDTYRYPKVAMDV